MMLKLAIAVLLLVSAFTFAQDQSPAIFGDPGLGVVGPQRIETDYTWAEGKWSNADANAGINSTIIHCLRKFGFCEEAEGYSFGGQSWVNLTTLDILRWDATELIAVDSTPVCEVNTVRFDFRTKQVSYTVTAKGVTKEMPEMSKKVCASIKPTTAFLGGLKDDLKKIKP
jgi:hypothetical protein